MNATSIIRLRGQKNGKTLKVSGTDNRTLVDIGILCFHRQHQSSALQKIQKERAQDASQLSTEPGTEECQKPVPCPCTTTYRPYLQGQLSAPLAPGLSVTVCSLHSLPAKLASNYPEGSVSSVNHCMLPQFKLRMLLVTVRPGHEGAESPHCPAYASDDYGSPT